MKKIAILIRENFDDYRIKRLNEEIINFKNVNILEAIKILRYPFEETDILNYDVYYFFVGMSFLLDRYLLAKYLEENGKIIVNRINSKVQILYKSYFYNLLYRYIKIPKFIKIYTVKNIEKVIEKIGFPMVIKHQFMHRGEFVYKISDKNELYNFLKSYLLNGGRMPHLIFQQFIPYEKDIRIIFIGEPFGAMERINERSFKANISQGGYGKEYKLDDELIELSYKISKKTDMQIFAFDVLLKDGEYYLIDIHDIFQFEGFEKHIRKNVMRKIIEFLNEVRN
ncbi:MAG: ATP-grasp domain-containing protein [Nanopusillaceae archaeon]